MKDYYNKCIDSMSKEILVAEDKIILELLNKLAKNIDLINSISYDELPMYINYKFSTSMGKELLSYRIKNKCLISKSLSDNFLYKFSDSLIKGV